MAERGRLAAVGLLSLAGLAGGAHAAPAADTETVAEDRQLSALASTATRQGMRLQLYAANDQTVRFESRHPPDDAHAADYVDFRLTGVTRDGKFFVVSERRYEGESTYWISRATGDKVEVHAPPEVSPDGRYIVTALHRESSGPSGVFIWEIVGDQLVRRAHTDHDYYGLFTFKRWVAKDKAELTLYSHQFLSLCPAGAQATTATMLLGSGPHGWGVFGPLHGEVRCE
jgi:hypothetical protein